MRSYERTVGERLEAMTEGGVAEYGKLVTILEDASERMAQMTAHTTFTAFLSSAANLHLDDHPYGENVFLTDQPHKLPFPKKVFHVTGGRALANLQNGNILAPTEAHYQNDTYTDKGILIHIVPAFMETLGVSTGNLQDFLFSGPQVDAEQVAHFNTKSGRNISNEGASIFVKRQDSDYVLSDDLRTVLTALDKGIKPVDDLILKEIVDQFIVKLFEIPNIREGWLNRIRDILYGTIPYNFEGKVTSLVDRMEFRLQTEMHMHRKLKDVIADPAVVLEIDTESLISDISHDGLFPVLVGGRPIASIFPSVAITPGAIVNAYAAPEFSSRLATGKIKIRSLDDLDDRVWLGGVSWRNANPQLEAPLCAIRYTQGEVSTWWDIAQSGLLAPVKTIEQQALFTPPMALVEVFGKEKFNFTGTESYQKYPHVFENAIETKFPYINGVFNRLNWH